ncbi:MAG: DUF1559 domain-containing protein [Planctomycetota bacterium]|nr:DUF1559 domain-containing protein [Planctomycetota bacterium]MDA1177353.1 DUF1559 domain-containing protein [Planctomycetota bacterium]
MSNSRRPAGFTLVELLVVIAIIGVLVALLLPAVQAARNAAMLLKCKNNIRQMVLACHNHESVTGTWPTGGDTPWPKIENYVSSSGALNSAEHQGLGWAFQILPYLEEGAVQNIRSQVDLDNTFVPLYQCPARSARRYKGVGSVLMDYAGVTPVGYTFKSGYTVAHRTDKSQLLESSFWQEYNEQVWVVGPNRMWRGVIVRSNWDIHSEDAKNRGPSEVGASPPTRFAEIVDGTSKTMVIGEKRVRPSFYNSDAGDDRGWTDGWDYDTMRSSGAIYGQDKNSITKADHSPHLGFGSAHGVGMHAGMADNSVRTINYTISPEIFERLADREDGNVIEEGAY